MTAAEALDFALKLATLISLVGGGGIIIYKMGRLTQKFELIGEQQSKEISELKVGVSKMEGVLVSLANQSGRVDRVEDRVALQGQRIDELTKRFNAVIDRGLVLKPLDPMEGA